MAARKTQLARITRTVTFIDEANTIRIRMVRKPAGTLVYVGREVNGYIRIRFPPTLLTQDVSADSLHLI
jgi:hypothetical protein